jgi:flagellar biosynthesis anti-sigma factor FlgM
MKIDLNNLPPSHLTAGPSTKKASNTGNIDFQSTTEDRTTFHSDSASVQSLTNQAMNSPAIRQSKVDALRQSVNGGTYEIDPGKIAEAFIASNGE